MRNAALICNLIWMLGVLDSSGVAQIPSTLEKDTPLKPMVQSLGDSIFQVGSIRINTSKRTVQFNTQVNLRDVLIEYAIVGQKGKLHESLLVCDFPPYHLHVAMLLLGAKDLRPESLKATHPPGHPIRIVLRWKDGDSDREAHLEDWILSETDHRPMTRGEWIYSGARIVDGFFTAQRDESMVAIILDMDALINNPRPGNQNDEIWYAHSEKVPPVGTPVTVAIQLTDHYPVPKPVSKSESGGNP